jgi:hypothetical protein
MGSTVSDSESGSFLRTKVGLIENLGTAVGEGIALADLLGEKEKTLGGVFVMCARAGLDLAVDAIGGGITGVEEGVVLAGRG